MSMRLRLFLFVPRLLAIFFLLTGISEVFSAAAPRVSRDLQVFYTFDQTQGTSIKDRSGIGQPLDLKIDHPSAVEWKNDGLLVRNPAKIISSTPATKFISAIQRSNSLTVEAWITPANLRQQGPARIISLSKNSSLRNFTLGQDQQKYEMRLRSTSTSSNGIPSTSTADHTVKTTLTHVVFTRNADGISLFYVNGKQQAQQQVKGKLSNWDKDYRLILANEVTGDRPWLGKFHLLALFSRALTPSEVQQNYQAGLHTSSSPKLTKLEIAATENKQLFETHIAPLFAKHCLDCHDSAARKGQLDLSRKSAALQGGESGVVLVPGKTAASLLWEQVHSGEMPPAGDSLTSHQKTMIKQWIDGGAHWSIEMLDPAVYLHDSRAGSHWLQRLTVPEYIETVRSSVNIDIEKEARKLLPRDLRADGFSNTAYNLNVDLKHVEIYARLAGIIVDRMDVLQFAARFSKSQKLSTDATMRKFVADMGKWLLRGPLNDREISTYSGIATTVASAGGNYKEAVSLIIEAMLQSPRFIYRIENQRGDGRAWPVGEYELASRMSYIIWGAPPDRELMRMADSGRLHHPEIAAQQVQRMLLDPRARIRSQQFASEWLHLDRLDHLKPASRKYPNWNQALASDMRQETLAYFNELIWEQNRPVADLFNAQFTYLTPRLAEHYGIKPQGTGLRKYDLTAVAARGGILSQGSILTIGGDDASMVTRGLFILEDVLRGTIKAPPAGLDITPIPSRPGMSHRGIAEQRIANAECSGCHSRFEPLAFGLEKFDGLGAFHERDQYKNQLREDGVILFPGEANPVAYDSSAALMNLLAASPRVQQTMTWKITQFSLGRPLTATDANDLELIHKSAQKEGGTYANLIKAIILSDLVQKTRTESQHTETGE
ncbi:DUF1592 domain-containing protein [Gimesia algae]|uniref:Planctomycete cytochrome C n=1 Tax=Gimesia algae TaxID=2527971 RepID=A0A517VF79_9PLAN|nr:DUF1592 domain-containing protein [Gimesia algae]QDT91662.1 Planctomycete cytochrome C [Gimesia algae]